MFQRFLLWVVAGALSVWISIAMVAAPGVAFAAPESGSNSVGTESSEPATPTKPTQQHKPAKTRAEKKPDARSAPSGTAGDHNDEAKDPPADHVTGADQKPEVKGPAKTPATSGADVDQDVHEGTEEGPKGGCRPRYSGHLRTGTRPVGQRRRRGPGTCRPNRRGPVDRR